MSAISAFFSSPEDSPQELEIRKKRSAALGRAGGQRELLGFVHDNETWLRNGFAIPDGVWSCYRRL